MTSEDKTPLIDPDIHREISRLSMDVILGEISRRYFEAKIQGIALKVALAERERCRLIAYWQSKPIDPDEEKSDKVRGHEACAKLIEERIRNGYLPV